MGDFMKVGLLLAGLFLTCVLPVGPVLAGDVATDIDCAKAMDQSSMNICADRDYRATDKKLNAAYAKLMAVQDGDLAKTRLRAAQRAWIGFRDAECAFETWENEGGTLHPQVYAGCLKQMTEERTKELLGFVP